MPLPPRTDMERFNENMDVYTRPLHHIVPMFINLTSLHIVGDWVSTNFLSCVAQVRNLLTLDVRDSFIASNLQPWVPLSDLPLRELTVLRCRVKPFGAENQAAVHLCNAFLSRSPNLISLEIDSFLAWAAGNVLSNLRPPASIASFSCSGVTPQDPHNTLLGHTLLALPAVTALKLSRAPRDFSTRIPADALRNLTNVTGQMKSLILFLGARRPLQYLTITDLPFTSVGGVAWESQLIHFFEVLHRQSIILKGVAFNISHWSQEVLLCISQLWQGIQELKIQCTDGPGVDQSFQISFGPHYLPRLSKLEVLHIYSTSSLYSHGTHRISKKGVKNVVQYPLRLTNEEREDIAEAPVHYRRWEKICPSLREVAFDREVWWRRATTEPGGWSFVRDVIPALVQESN
ncbi:hypothetical protein BU17DRAFT_79224 [Hysterangium stoloniferum]|nr:hypothetical protein BU17DRAFT_79224 [Hysterangium stoloniferum]